METKYFGLRKWFSIFSVLIVTMMNSQTTFRITDIPSDNTKGLRIFMASNINDWKPNDERFEFKKNAEGFYSLTIPAQTGKIEYKITQGNWDIAETDENGNSIQNRVLENSDKSQIVELKISDWSAPKEKKHTTTSNVKILSENFTIPQLNTTRKIWIYLPPDYETSKTKYPVIYMHDGQNLFDEFTSFSGEWSVDETMDEIYKAMGKSAIVIGIDNGGDKRLSEYSPWNNVKYKTSGEGDLYVDFLAKTLKPYIDKTYRTEKQASKTLIMGSSMGGLISLYASAKYPTVFGKAGIFSPAFWFVSENLKKYLNINKNNLKNSKFYFVAGKNEDETMAPEIENVNELLLKKSVPAKNIIVKIDEDGTHSESYWKRELKASLIWLLE
ncbi:alpha/beta hydrolase-fold protein [Epilithonimonas ginsengisoli]|uniref:Alpha/beta hydrolase-fold protein n=1 Tax=Epilithonimonas ginsengisoli TaxID=1245592 RepID=A0ABU4JFC9_9FLAO|nr:MULTISPECIES: alpha/beta hydrolase-fold protein [Chryseobacterium group]MBV6879746.1 alpha/beta hydrolase [Epilithonimonas sp. FP105]MDW8548385.1 alpha/beta hydrolase-fold protein [Epilithonimonas ginsengisoli]